VVTRLNNVALVGVAAAPIGVEVNTSHANLPGTVVVRIITTSG
jgi:hypothetical protein